eukprot:CCRYP_008340-RA/>CCRYP_008340-RA protein AED:0.36 eAED:0.36 QI:0/0/0/1/0/0/2/0/286
MGIYHDVFDALKGFEISKIEGQPTDEDINKLTTQLTAALVTIETKNAAGKLGHIGIVIPEHRYLTLSGRIKFDKPICPGAYPVGASDDAETREKQVAEHKAEINEFETYKACMAWTRQTIVILVDKEWISELKDEDLGYQLADPLNLLNHLRDAGGNLDDMEITDLNTQMLARGIELKLPSQCFHRQTSSSVNSYDLASQSNPKSGYLMREYTKQVKQNRSTAGSVGKGIANTAMEDQRVSDAEAQAIVIAEVANVLQAQNQEQMKAMVSMIEKLLTSVQPLPLQP